MEMAAFQYRFVTTVDDLVDADAIERARQPQRILRGLMELVHQLERTQLWIIGGLIALGLIVFVWSSTGVDWLAITFVVGLVLLYYFVIAPRRARERIRKQNPRRQTVRLEFGREGVSVDVEDAGSLKKAWDEFSGATEAKRGVLLYFGTTTMWMPQRVFASDHERREFMTFVKQYEPIDTPP
jgi:hypothetical protein